MRRTILAVPAALTARRGDGLRRPLNAPPPNENEIGVQPGISQALVNAIIAILSGVGSGLFVYNPGAGPGTLIDSITGYTGTDPFTNQIIHGINNYQLNTNGNGYLSVVNIQGGEITFWVTDTDSLTSTSPKWWQATGTNSFQVVLNAYPSIGGTQPGFHLAVASGTAGVNDFLYFDNSARIASAVQFYRPSGDLTGVTDRTNINAFLAAGIVVQLVPGIYWIDQNITMPTSGTLLGTSAPPLNAAVPVTGVSVIKEISGFSSAAAVTLNATSQVTIRDVVIDGTLGASGDGIQLQNACLDTTLTNILVQAIAGNGIASTGSGANTVRGTHLTVHQAGGIGFTCNVTDSTWIDCLSLGAGSEGWFIGNGNANSKFIGCRSEFSASHGFQLSGSWNTGTGAGGPHFAGCSTDRNAKSGVFISATGTQPVQFTGHYARRDGSSSTTQFAGFEISSATIPVTINGLAVYPGVNDDGSGNLSPWTGLNSSGPPTLASVTGAYLHAATQGLNGSAPYGLSSYRNIQVRTGSTASPSAITKIGDSVGTWASLGTLANYTVNVGRYRTTTRGEIELDISVTSAGANAASVTFSNALPAGYGGGSSTAYPLASNRLVAAADSIPRVIVDSAGNVTVAQTANVNALLTGQAFVPTD